MLCANTCFSAYFSILPFSCHLWISSHKYPEYLRETNHPLCTSCSHPPPAASCLLVECTRLRTLQAFIHNSSPFLKCIKCMKDMKDRRQQAFSVTPCHHSVHQVIFNNIKGTWTKNILYCTAGTLGSTKPDMYSIHVLINVENKSKIKWNNW